ncbi:hypothetical protein W909_14090 [Dickeya zeae EC1]|nr:hypothetical protein W909_14090 [Dickeya zeae EC1]
MAPQAGYQVMIDSDITGLALPMMVSNPPSGQVIMG